ncbi:MAG: ParA family protein [Candidatus Dojkabacteria bacterium]
MYMVISFANQKGGVGKTTTTLNIAASLAKDGKKILALDLDPQANLTSGLGVELKKDESSIYEAISSAAEGKEDSDLNLAILDESRIGIDGLGLVPSRIELAGAEIELVNAISREQTVKNLLEPLRKNYDYILIDCPPSLGLLTINALAAADSVIIPVQAEYFALEGLSQLLNTFKLVKNKINPNLQLMGIAITMYDARTNLAKEVAKELVETFPDKVFNTIIPRNIRLSEAPSHGKPVSYYAPDSQGAVSYQALAEEIKAKT